MPTIYAYQKVTDQHTTYQLLTPEGSIELATLDGVTYVSVPDGEELPDHQPEQIAESIETATLTPELVAAIKAASPYVKNIQRQVREMIAEKYSLEDEVKLLRTRPSAEFDDYDTYAESCRAWGRQQYAALGLVAPDPE